MNSESPENFESDEGVEDKVETGVNPETAVWQEEIQATKFDHGAFREGLTSEALTANYSQREGSPMDPQEQFDAIVKNIEYLRGSGASLDSDEVMTSYGKLRFWYEKIQGT